MSTGGVLDNTSNFKPVRANSNDITGSYDNPMQMLYKPQQQQQPQPPASQQQSSQQQQQYGGGSSKYSNNNAAASGGVGGIRPGATKQYSYNNNNSSSNNNGSTKRSAGGVENATNDMVNTRKVFVGGLSPDTKMEDLCEYFAKFGVVESATVKFDKSGRSKGFGFVLFEDRDTTDKVYSHDLHVIRGKRVDTKSAHRRDQALARKVFVGGLDTEVSDNELHEYFSKFGKIAQIEAPMDKIKQKRRPFCFILFENEQSAEDVLQQQRHTIGGKQVDCKRANPKNTDNNNSNNQQQQQAQQQSYMNTFSYQQRGGPPQSSSHQLQQQQQYQQALAAQHGFPAWGAVAGGPGQQVSNNPQQQQQNMSQQRSQNSRGQPQHQLQSNNAQSLQQHNWSQISPAQWPNTSYDPRYYNSNPSAAASNTNWQVTGPPPQTNSYGQTPGAILTSARAPSTGPSGQTNNTNPQQQYNGNTTSNAFPYGGWNFGSTAPPQSGLTGANGGSIPHPTSYANAYDPTSSTAPFYHPNAGTAPAYDYSQAAWATAQLAGTGQYDRAVDAANYSR
ncbi:unnamed protein product [Didymodactylos carnosus]|uniref:RRM domain-containing protein n=1 Tax=Didymodactylos carnosus TaxID=1234261 RepID=A0A8S2CSH4_9BILA|nr:unnamed protein product [Didymodactylos carnosus]CAF3574790.1 unnamed protein product [Didymodactylos carnosus]